MRRTIYIIKPEEICLLSLIIFIANRLKKGLPYNFYWEVGFYNNRPKLWPFNFSSLEN